MSKKDYTGADIRTEANARVTQGSALKSIGNLVRPYIKQAIPKKNVVFQQLFDMWPSLIAQTEAGGSIPEKLVFPVKKQQDAVLHIWAKSSAQAMEISFNKTAWIQRINAVFGYNVLADIRVTAHGSLTAARPKTAWRSANPANVNAGQGLSSQSLDKILSDISNPELRSALRDLGGVLDSQANDTPDTQT